MSGLPAFIYSDNGLSKDQAFEEWRRMMAPMFSIFPANAGNGLPRGGLSAFLLGDIMASRCFFNAQHLKRQKNLISATPDHFVLRLYKSGGFVGEFDGQSVRTARGRVAICDLRRPLDVEAMTSDTIGLTIPRAVLTGIDIDRLPPRLDPIRESLLAARIVTLYQRLQRLALSDTHAVTEDLLTALRRLFDPSMAADVLDGPEFDADLLTLAERSIATAMETPDLSPATIAEQLNVSRATLYRVFAPVGGVMQHVLHMRLDAVKVALDQPTAPQTLTRLATDHGFKSSAHLSRSFRARFGISPRAWRQQRASQVCADTCDDPRLVQAWWRNLGP